MKLSFLVSASAVVSAALCSAPASAAVYVFDLTGGKTANFSIDTSVAPDYSSSSFIGDQIRYDDVMGTFGGTPQTASISFGTFLISALDISGTSLGFTQYAGPALFSLVDGSPVFNTGTFDLSSITSGPATITISEAASGAVPEPATWAMMLIGFGAVGAAARYRRRKVRVTFA